MPPDPPRKVRLRRTITLSITYEHPLENLSYAPEFSIPRNKDCSSNVRPSNYSFITWSMNHEAAHKIKSFWRKRKRNLSLLDRLAFNKIANMMPWHVMEERGIHLCFPCQAVDPIISRFIFFALEFQTGEILLVTSWFKYKVTVLLRFLFWKTTDCL